MNNEKTGTLKGRIVLVVEDTDSNYELIKVLLLSQGAEVDRAISGEEAITKFKGAVNYDLIVMDIKLGGMDGYQTTRIIRETDKELPIVANTAYVIDGEREKAIEAGCNAYIAKPVDINVLIEQFISLILNK
jgi:two-component system, cell cycle response regulator DivK